MKILLLSSIILVFLARLHLGLVRYFDADEFAHMHWTYLLALGQIPYRDIFIFHVPVFQWMLRPLLYLPADGSILILSRVLMVGMYIGIAIFIFQISRGISRTVLSGFLATLLFLIFPMTLDKSLEIRPDLLMIVFFILAVSLLISPRNTRIIFLSGILYGISLLIFPKMLFALPSIGYLLISHKHGKNSWNPLLLWGAGFILPLGLFLYYLLAHGIFYDAWTAFSQTSVIAYSGKPRFSPMLALSPFPLMYLERGGVSLPWIINTLIFAFSFFGLIISYRLHKRFFHASILYMLFGVIFLFLFPSPYVQYFLPLSVAASILAGLWLTYVINRAKPAWGSKLLLLGVITTLLVSFGQQYRIRVGQNADNGEQLQVITDALRISKPDETFYDVVGSYVFRPDGFFICCHPYGEFIDNLQPQGPALRLRLRESLVARQTKFLVMDRTGFIFWKTPEPDLTFLLTNYLPTKYKKIYSLGQEFRCVNGACTQYRLDDKPAANRSTNTFAIVVPETYTVTTQPNDEMVIIDSQNIQNGQILPLTAGAHRFTAPPAVTSFRIQLART